MKQSERKMLFIDQRSESVSFCLAQENRLSAPLALSREMRCHPPKSAFGCTLVGNPTQNLRTALIAAGEQIDWSSTTVLFGAPHDPFSGGLSALSSALNSLEFLVAKRPRRLIVQTRSTLVLLAVPLLQFCSTSEVRLAFEAADDPLHHRLLPSFSRPSERLETLATLRSARVDTSIQVAPLIVRRASSLQIKKMAEMISRTGAPYQVYSIDILLSARVDPQLLALHRARRILLPEAHRLLRSTLLHSTRSEYPVERTA